jgi:FAD/FMN-containing dehydrogenase
MAGLTLGGGYGPLIGRYGLALDNLVGVELVLADGRLVTADAVENAELFWALRGGGGNFGIATAMRVRLHPIRMLLSGLILFPWSEAEAVLRGYAKAVASAPDELAVMAGVLPGPEDDPVLFLAPIWSGTPAKGQAIMAGLQRLGTPLLTRVGPMTCGDMLGMFDAHVVNGRHYAIQTRWIPELTPHVLSALLAGGSNRSSTCSGIVLHHFHGAATRVPLEATAFGIRREHFLVEIVAAWEATDEATGAIHRQWAQALSQDLAPAALPGGYPNLLGPDERDRIALAYGRNIDRLQSVKRRFDPEGMLTSAIALPT